MDAMPFVQAASLIAGAAEKLGIKHKKIASIREAASSVIDQVSVLTLPDRFNDSFAVNGWIANSSMAVDTMESALSKHESGDFSAAEAIILKWFTPENINLFAINRSKRFNKASDRWHQLQEARLLTAEGRYYSAVPLILIACDGFASDVLGRSPFEKNADLSAFDSISGHTTGLPALIKQITKGIRKSSDDPLEMPMRHGILHGQSLGYANEVVCKKAWHLMISLVDWAHDKSSEGERRQKLAESKNVSWKDIADRRRKLNADKVAIEAFVPTSTDGPFDGDLDVKSPEYAFRDFFSAWRSGNFGRMAARAVNIVNKPLKRMAGQLRQDADLIRLTDFEIRSVRHVTIARAEARIFLKGEGLKGACDGEFNVLAFLHDPDDDLAITSGNARWQVQQGCMFALLHGRTIETEESKKA